MSELNPYDKFLDGRALDILIYLADRPGEVIAKRDAPQDDLSKGR